MVAEEDIAAVDRKAGTAVAAAGGGRDGLAQGSRTWQRSV